MNPRRRSWPALAVLCVLLWSGGSTPAWAGAALNLDFDEANRLYAQGSFAEAAAAYEHLATNRASLALRYNEGNAWFKAGRLGRAIAAYQQALALDPRDPDTLANLRFARERVAAPTVPPGRVAAAFARLTLNEWTGLFCAAFWLCFGLLAAGEFWAGGRARLRRYALWAGAGAAGLGLALLVALRFDAAPRVVVISPGAVVRSSPFEEAPTVFTASDGAEFPVLDTKNGWHQISDGSKRTGWIKADAVARFGRP
jgi:tetratricopeptide (TPR) repeat protein